MSEAGQAGRGGGVTWPQMVGYVSQVADQLRDGDERVMDKLEQHEGWHRRSTDVATRASRTWRITLALVVATAMGSIAVSVSTILLVIHRGG